MAKTTYSPLRLLVGFLIFFFGSYLYFIFLKLNYLAFFQLFLSLPILLVILALVFKRKPLSSAFFNTFSGSLLVYTLLVYVIFPFTLLNFFYGFLIVIVSFALPFYSLKLTWWIYTFGGRIRPQDDFLWIENKLKVGGDGGRSIKTYAGGLSILTALSLITASTLADHGFDTVLLLKYLGVPIFILAFILPIGLFIKGYQEKNLNQPTTQFNQNLENN